MAHPSGPQFSSSKSANTSPPSARARARARGGSGPWPADTCNVAMLMTGSMDHGQGHGTTFKQVLSEKLGIDADLIRYRFGDSDLVTMGIGTFGSRSAQLAGSAIVHLRQEMTLTRD